MVVTDGVLPLAVPRATAPQVRTVLDVGRTCRSGLVMILRLIAGRVALLRCKIINIGRRHGVIRARRTLTGATCVAAAYRMIGKGRCRMGIMRPGKARGCREN